MAVLTVTLAAVLVTSANANTYHHPYHRPVHRVVMHHEVHPVNRHYENRDTEHPHH